MSKFLKFIVHFVVICAVLCVVALVAPPFFGITTVVMDDPDRQTNLPMGSVTYAIPVRTEEVALGTRILVEEDGKTYRYNVMTLDSDNRTGTVADPTVSGSETLTVAVKNFMPKVVVTVGLIGYLKVATKSVEGLIILGLAVLVLVILYVIAELWKKDPEDEEEDDEEEDIPVKSKKELKREEKEREKRMKEEDKRLLKEAKENKKAEKKKKSLIKTGGFVDEVYEEDFEPDEAEEKVSQKAKAQEAASEAHAVLKKEIAATTAEENDVKEKETAKKQARPRPVKAAEEPKKPVETKRMAIPRYSAAQLAEKAQKAGDQPEVLQDEITKVTLFDYSDIIGGDE